MRARTTYFRGRMPKLSKGRMRSKAPTIQRSYMPRVHRALRGRSSFGGSMKRKLFR